MTIENNSNYSSDDHVDDVSEYTDDLLSNNVFELDNNQLSARRRVEDYFDEKLLHSHLKDIFADDLD